MKKTYLQPQILVEHIETSSIICGSQDVHSTLGDDNIGYGGVDEDGTITPSARRHHGVWDEDEEEEW